MPFVTRLRLRSGDREALERLVDEITARASRKGVQLKGPHARPSTSVTVPLYKRPPVTAGGTFERWRYTLYTRTIEIHGHDTFARTVLEDIRRETVHVEAEVELVG